MSLSLSHETLMKCLNIYARFKHGTGREHEAAKCVLETLLKKYNSTFLEFENIYIKKQQIVQPPLTKQPYKRFSKNGDLMYSPHQDSFILKGAKGYELSRRFKIILIEEIQNILNAKSHTRTMLEASGGKFIIIESKKENGDSLMTLSFMNLSRSVTILSKYKIDKNPNLHSSIVNPLFLDIENWLNK